MWRLDVLQTAVETIGVNGEDPGEKRPALPARGRGRLAELHDIPRVKS